MEERTLPLRPVRQALSRRTLESMLDAAERLLHGRSFQEISLTELVREAGVTTGAFYGRFASKDNLLPCLYPRYLSHLSATYSRGFQTI